MTQPLFSIIVPVYQVKDYLPDCLDSLMAQTLGDFEVICIDDGSTDGSLAVLEAYASIDTRIRIISQANAGLSAARNRGIDAASGRYLLFVDADDSLVPEACSVLAERFADSAAEIVTFGASLQPPEAHDSYLEALLSPRDVLYDGFSPQLLFRENSHPYVWRSAFSADFFHRTGLRFDETVRFGEDEVFYFAAYPLSQRTLLASDKLYRYRLTRPDSLMEGRRQSRGRIGDHLEIVRRVLASWSELGLLGEYPGWIWEWVLEFVAYDIATTPPDEQVGLLRGLGAILALYLKADDLSGLGLMPASASVLSTALMAEHTERPRISWSQLQRWRLARRWRLSRED